MLTLKTHNLEAKHSKLNLKDHDKLNHHMQVTIHKYNRLYKKP